MRINFGAGIGIWLLMAAEALAQGGGGALPKGAEPDAGKATGPEQGSDKKRRNCFLDLTQPPGGNGHFMPDGKTLYLLAQTGAADDEDSGKGKKKKKKAKSANLANAIAAKSKYTLFKINPKTRKGEAMVSLDHRGSASLLTYGNPVKAISAIAFAGPAAGCFEGPAGVVSVSFAKKTEKAVQDSGQFQLVNSADGLRLVDAKKGNVLELDSETFQSKLGRKIAAGDRPLYYDQDKHSLTVWHEGAEQRGLAFFPSEDESGVKRLAFKKGDRVLQDGDRYAVAHLNGAANTIDVQELVNWTKVEKAGRYKLTIPPAYSVASAGMDINFDKHLVLVYGANFLAKQKWQRLFVFDYKSGELLGAVPVTGTQYLNFAAIDPTGTYVVIEVRDMATRQTVGGKVFDVAKKSFDDLDLAMPKGG